MLSHLDEIYAIGSHYTTTPRVDGIQRSRHVPAPTGWSILSSYPPPLPSSPSRRGRIAPIHRYTDRDERFGGALKIDLRKNGTYLTEPRVESRGSNSMIDSSPSREAYVSLYLFSGSIDSKGETREIRAIVTKLKGILLLHF